MKSLVILELMLIIYGAVGFNLESRIPVIKRGRIGSYFGYSVAEHQELVEEGIKTTAPSW